MIKRIRILGFVMMGLYLVLFAQLNRLQFFGAERIQAMPENTRSLVRAFGQERGPIITADNVLVAHSIPNPDSDIEFRREYPEGDLYGHITGFQSLNVGSSGLERSYNDELAGETIDQQFHELSDLITDRDTTATLVLSVRDNVQRAARDALGDTRGSVVALDPRTGAVLAMWSNPSYDPNPIAATDGNAANEAYQGTLAADGNPLLAKAYREIYFPGSTFKVVTAAAGLASGLITPEGPVYPRSTGYEPLPAGRAIRNFGGSTCGGALFEIMKISCNTAFAEMGAEWVGPTGMIATSEAFGFNQAVPFDLPDPATSVFPTDYGAPIAPVSRYRGAEVANAAVEIFENTARLAQTSIGQNDVSATPLQMAMVAAAIANDGVIMEPHVVGTLRSANGDVYDTVGPTEWLTAMTAIAADTLRQAMIGVVDGGTASRLGISGMTVGGKTGTAQLGTDPPKSHAWIIGFAGPPGGAAEVAVAVLVEAQDGASEQTGGTVAAPIAKAVMEAALTPLPEPVPNLGTEESEPN